MKKPALFPSLLTLSWFVLAAAVVAVSLVLSDGHLVYTLDDPYIHLAVAENILQGGYGVNENHFSSPSSSILFPLLLAGTEFIGLGTWGPLAINLLAMGAAVFTLGLLLTRHVLPDTDISLSFALPGGLAIAACMNAWGLPMTGMEHSLHVLGAVLFVLGFAEMERHKRVTWWLLVSIVAMPLLRFEGLALG
jgi:hypothetical protein